MFSDPIVGQILTMLAVLIIPGMVVNWISGLKLPWAVAASLPTTAGVVGFAGWALSRLGQDFNLRTIISSFVVVSVLALLWRLGFIVVWWRIKKRQQREPDSNPSDKKPCWRRFFLESPGSVFQFQWVLPLAGIVTSTWLIIAKVVAMMRGLPYEFGEIVQGWDVHWHASEVRYILDMGMADSTRMGEAHNIDGQLPMYYPSGWHAVTASLAWIMDFSAIEAINWMNILLPAAALPVSVAVIAWRIVGDRSIIAQVAAGFSASLVVALPVLYWVPSFVGMWPYLGAISMASIVAALFMSVPAAPIRAFAAVVGFMGVVIMHPAPVTVIVVLLGVWWLLDLVWRPARTATTIKGQVGIRARDFALLAATGLVAVGLLLPQLLAGRSVSADVQEVSAYEDISRWESFFNTVTMQTRHANELAEINWTWLLVLALIGIIAMIAYKKNLWAPIFLVISILLTANALKLLPAPLGDLLNMVGTLHYGTAHRLVIPVALFLLAFAGVGVAWLAWLVFSKIPYKVASVGLTAIAGFMAAGYVVPMAVKEVETAPEFLAEMYDTRTVTTADRKAFAWLAQQPKAYEGHIFGEHADGHGWMYVYNGLPSVARHYVWPVLADDAPTHIIHNSAYLIGAGNHDDPDQLNKVDQAVADLDVTFIYISPPNFWHFQHTNLELTVKVDNAPGLTKVYQDKEIRIYAVNTQFTDAELTTMREKSKEPLPPVPTYQQLGITTDDPALADQPYYHRSTKPAAGPGPDITDLAAQTRLQDDNLLRADKGSLRYSQFR